MYLCRLECSVPALPLARLTQVLQFLRGTCRLALKVCERKVRAAQDAPLLKVEAVCEGRLGQKKTTAPLKGVRVRRRCKRPPAGG